MGNQKRLDLRVDVFEHKSQWAKPLPTLKPAELVDAILQEFQEVEYLSKSATDYYLVSAENGEVALQEELPLQQQVANESRLKLLEVEQSLPEGAERPSKAVYLREVVSGQVYKLHWLPAIIGRPDKNQPHDDRIAVDLESYKTGLRVSRRHAQVVEENGNYFVESLSRNPTLLRTVDGTLEAVDDQKQPLKNGDVIQLERSNIALKFIVRSPENGPSAE